MSDSKEQPDKTPVKRHSTVLKHELPPATNLPPMPKVKPPKDLAAGTSDSAQSTSTQRAGETDDR